MNQRNYNNNGTVFIFSLSFVLAVFYGFSELVLSPMGYDMVEVVKQFVQGLF